MTSNYVRINGCHLRIFKSATNLWGDAGEQQTLPQFVCSLTRLLHPLPIFECFHVTGWLHNQLTPTSVNLHHRVYFNLTGVKKR